MSVKVSTYDVNAGWTSLLDYFNVDVNGTSRNDDDAMSFAGARAAYTTTYVASLSTTFTAAHPALHVGRAKPPISGQG